jgi:RimK family alpha-L-glutamate ligase
VGFYCVVRSLEDKRFPNKCFGFLKDACQQRGIDFIPVEASKLDVSNLPVLGKGDMLFRLTTDLKSSSVFAQLLRPDVTTFYIDNSQGAVSYTSNGWTNTIAHRLNGLPIIPTIIDLPNNHELLAKYVKKLGGYPIIVKAQGGSHGVGVMKFDSQQSLFSVSDYLRASGKETFALRKYIDFSAQARLIVVGEKVVASLNYTPPEGDFRSNIGHAPIAKEQKFSPKIEAVAVAATHAIGYEFSGVDILIDRNGKDFFIAEVNHPCNFSRPQNITGIDIAGAMVDHLKSKAK